MKRIFIPENVLAENPLVLTGEIFHQAARVLRVRKGDTVIALCGDGFEYTVEIKNSSKNHMAAEIRKKTKIDNEAKVKISLYQGCLKGKGIEEIIPPLVYLGVSRLVPVKTSRSEGSYDPGSKGKRNRIDGIIHRATALSHRTRLMTVEPLITFREALEECKTNKLNLIFWESSNPSSLKKLLSMKLRDLHFYDNGIPREIGVFIGPEGGFTGEEIEIAGTYGVVTTSLGRRILDAKTAPLTAITSILYEIGDI